MRLFVVCLMLCCRAVYAVPCSDVDSVLRFLEETRTLSLDFVQFSTTQTESGHLWAEKNGRFRLEVQGLEPLLIVNDGRILWNFSPVLEQVIQQRAEHFIAHSPLAIFLEHRDAITHFFTMALSRSAAHTCSVTFVPKRAGAYYRLLRLSLSSTGLPRSLAIVSALDHETTKMIFTHVQRNQPIEKNRFFVFHIPPNVDVVTMGMVPNSQ